jgi:GTPase SAR1 family protein
MRLPKLLLLLLASLLVLMLLLWIIDSVQRLYWQVAYTSPLLAGLFSFLLIGLILGLVGVGGYYLYLFTRPSQRKVRPLRIPEAKAEAAQETLKAVERQVAQIQDEVARQALLEQSRAIAQELERGDLRVVVFGTGSAGKTSLIRALLGRIVGTVGAPMGSTTEGETYRLSLRGLERDILITDTPGILEAGLGGQQREQLARQLAVEADLLIFVVDNALRRSEFEPLEQLAAIGKRSLLVFNKTDLYSSADQAAILAQLKQQVQNLIRAQDVIAVSANPRPLHLPNQQWFQPEPDVLPLLRRIAAVLRAEGEELLADNILLQSQRLGDRARQLLERQRRRSAEQVVERYQWISAGVIAVTPLPGIDLLGTAAVNAQMVVEIGRIYGCDMNLERGRELALSLGRTLASLGVIKGAVELIATALQFNVATLVVGKAVQAVSAAYLTRIAGGSFIEFFRQDQSWGDGGMTEVVKRQFQLDKRESFIREFIQQALVKVVEPLTARLEGRQLPPRDPRRPD